MPTTGITNPGSNPAVYVDTLYPAGGLLPSGGQLAGGYAPTVLEGLCAPDSRPASAVPVLPSSAVLPNPYLPPGTTQPVT